MWKDEKSGGKWNSEYWYEMGRKHFFDSYDIMSESTEDLSKVAIPEGDDDSQKQKVGFGFEFCDIL